MLLYVLGVPIKKASNNDNRRNLRGSSKVLVGIDDLHCKLGLQSLGIFELRAAEANSGEATRQEGFRSRGSSYWDAMVDLNGQWIVPIEIPEEFRWKNEEIKR